MIGLKLSAGFAAVAAVLMLASQVIIDAMVFIYQYFNIGAQ